MQKLLPKADEVPNSPSRKGSVSTLPLNSSKSFSKSLSTLSALFIASASSGEELSSLRAKLRWQVMSRSSTSFPLPRKPSPHHLPPPPSPPFLTILFTPRSRSRRTRKTPPSRTTRLSPSFQALASTRLSSVCPPQRALQQPPPAAAPKPAPENESRLTKVRSIFGNPLSERLIDVSGGDHRQAGHVPSRAPLGEEGGKCPYIVHVPMLILTTTDHFDQEGLACPSLPR